MGNLRAHAANDLVIFDRHDAAGRGFHRVADGFEIHVVDERIVDDGGTDALFG